MLEGAELGLSWEEFIDLSWVEFGFLRLGYEIRRQRSWDEVRTIIASLYNSSGFSKKTVRPQNVIKLPLVDRQPKAANVKRMDEETVKRLISYFDIQNDKSKN